MKKFLTILGIAGLSLTVAACSSNDDFSGSSSLQVECRTAGFDCVEDANGNLVKVKKSKAKKAKRVFEYSNRK